MAGLGRTFLRKANVERRAVRAQVIVRMSVICPTELDSTSSR